MQPAGTAMSLDCRAVTKNIAPKPASAAAATAGTTAPVRRRRGALSSGGVGVMRAQVALARARTNSAQRRTGLFAALCARNVQAQHCCPLAYAAAQAHQKKTQSKRRCPEGQRRS
jgi:hypothetical protein